MVRFIAVILCCALLFGCAPNKPGDEKGISLSNDHLIVKRNDTISLYVEGLVPWMALRASGERPPKKVDTLLGADTGIYVLVRVAHIPAMTIEGATVQANDIVIHGTEAYIAYNYAGDQCIGAIQIVNITDANNPAILEEVKFANMDINALYVDGEKLIFGGQTDPEIWGFKSFVGELNPHEILIDNIINSIIGLSSHATSGICKHGDYYYVGVGAQSGEIEVLDKNYKSADSLLVDDVRDVAAYESGITLIAGTTDNQSTQGRILIVKATDLHNPLTIPVINFGSNYHKATIEVFQGITALLGLSAAGFQVYDLKTATKLFETPNPDVVNGIPTNTNSVSSDGNLIFTANGGYGFRVFRPNNKNFATVEKIGFYHPTVENPQETGYTANDIVCKSNYVFVASGAAGVHVYSLKKKT